MFEQLTRKPVCGHANNLSSHLCKYMMDCHFRALFGVSLHMAFLLWTVTNVSKEGPSSGKEIHLLWMLMFLNDYSNGETWLEGMVCVVGVLLPWYTTSKLYSLFHRHSTIHPILHYLSHTPLLELVVHGSQLPQWVQLDQSQCLLKDTKRMLDG